MRDQEPLLVAFGEELRRLREASGLTQEALAQAAGLSRRTLVALEAGQANPTLLKLLGLARALHVSPGRLADALLDADNPTAAEAAGQPSHAGQAQTPGL